MDVNGTKFQLLLGRADWARCTDERGRALAELLTPAAPPPAESMVAYDDRQQVLTLRPRLFQFRTGAQGVPVRPDDRRGAGRDRFGTWYWISDDRRELLVNSAGTRATTHFWAAGDGERCELPAGFGAFAPRTHAATTEPMEFSGLAVTEDHYLVVGVRKLAGLLLFDLHAGGPPRLMCWPEEIAFAPLDMAPRPGGGVWILDRDPDDPAWPVRYWALDRHFNVVHRAQPEAGIAAAIVDDFLTLGADGATIARTLPRRTFPGGITLEAASPLGALDAIAIEALPDDTVLILDGNGGAPFAQVYHYDFARQLGVAVALDVIAGLIAPQPQPFTLRAHDFAFVPEHQSADGIVPDRLFIVDEWGNQSFAFNLSQQDEQLRLAPLAEFLPLHLFGGKALVRAGAQVFYDTDGRWTPLVAQRRPRYEVAATLLTEPLDSARPDCVWHRLLLDACLPPETAVEVWSRAAAEASELKFAAWQREPDFYLRGTGAELPFYRYGTTPDSLRQGRGTWELALQRARGRWLQLRLTLRGDGRISPRLHALRVYYPRFSYLENYLPAVYREDEASAAFLERWLANLEGIYTTIEERIAAAQMLFDWRSTPPEALAWLAGWLGLTLDPGWDDARRRLLLRHAMELFQYRGTIPGLQMALRLALDECADEAIFTDPFRRERPHGIRIIERFRTRQTPSAVLGDVTNTGNGGAAAHRFTVLLPLPPRYRTDRAEQQRRRTLTTRVLDWEKPAHTVFDVKFYWALFQAGQVRLGVDTVLEQGSRAPQLLPPLVLDQSYLAEGRLASGYAPDVAERRLLGCGC